MPYVCKAGYSLDTNNTGVTEFYIMCEDSSSFSRATTISMEVHMHRIRDGVLKIRASLLHKGESLFKMKFAMVL